MEADMWWLILILIVVIVVIWWLLRQNAQATEVPAHEEPVQEQIPSVRAETVPTEPVKPDDLAIIEGIGPKIASIFQSAGISTFAQLAAQEPANLKDILEKAGLRLGDPTTWPQQAKLASEGKWDELQSLQETLKGGRIKS